MSDEPLVLASHLHGEGHFRSTVHNVIPILCDEDRAYSLGVAKHWCHPGPLVVVEHDIEATNVLVSGLLECNYSVCSWAFALHWASSGRVEDVYAHKNDGLPVEYGTEWADWSAPGFMKIAPEARTGPIVECHWRRVEDAINAAITGPVHLHWPPVQHHHW